MAQPLQELTQFVWLMQNSTKQLPTLKPN